ncbi:hypothetical protein BV394_00940 [Brevirhabdus pacifica]|uniref:Uncharacterized protein n=1 Tax=Brevirhabdus pacifica TaxID=1267768 RepID=A0A1U7DEZ7_9RHOB|nr:RDD family protein [Brevirhabdus pacifica]APX88469.1 hypothetical protein BV394_00940 [Brevirhabdus pacifica]PJJ87059.1 putative RDD family membrane protein YckC [Brevirhabdus pacifica]
MHTQPIHHRLPDPVEQEEFYRDVPTKRAIAWIVDVLITALLTALVVPFTLFTALFYLPFLYMLVGWIYRSASMASGSATLGMRLTGLVVLDRDGDRLDAATAVLHTTGYVASMSFVIPQLVSVALMLTSARRQGLSDMVLGTVALNRAAEFHEPARREGRDGAAGRA